jgi:Fe-S cluster biogenesis protein NfuA
MDVTSAGKTWKMFIETEGTPNPATLKFLPGRDVMGAGTADFASSASAARSPLAGTLFALPGISRVFLGSDFVTVTKTEDTDWQALKPQVLGAIMEHFVAGRPVMEASVEGADEDLDEDVSPEDSEIVAQIKELLDTRVRPAVASDGGDIVFRGFREGVVKLHMQGACSGCPSSAATLKHGIENMLRHYVPEVVAVEQVEF